MTNQVIDVYDLLTEKELSSVTEILLEAYSRKNQETLDIFEVVLQIKT